MRCPICETDELTAPEPGNFFVMVEKKDSLGKETGVVLAPDTFCIEPGVEVFHCRGGHHFYIPKKFL